MSSEQQRHEWIRLQREREVLESLLKSDFAKKLERFAQARDKEDQNG